MPRTAPSPSALHRAHLFRRTAALALSVFLVAVGLGLPSAAQAVTVTYEITGSWGANTPDPVRSGTVLSSTWRYNINDADAAPQNPIRSDVVLTITAENAVISALPGVCLVSDVAPASSISSTGKVLTCNLGERALGTAELVLAGVQVDGDTGDMVRMSAKIGEPRVNEVSAELPELGIVNPFAMDMQFNSGTPRSAVIGGSLNEITFPWALRHAPGSNAGPTNAEFTLSFSSTGGETLTAAGCGPQTLSNPGYPSSGSAQADERTAPFAVGCTLTKLASPANTFRLTITGVDYSKTFDPVKDSLGNPLPTGWDVVAAGLIRLRFTYALPSTISFTSDAPNFTSVVSETSADLTNNNANSVAVTRGVWSGGWLLDWLPTPVQGSIWTDTFRTLAGQQVLATSAVRPPTGAEAVSRSCSVLDTKYVTFQSAASGSMANGVVTPFAGVTLEYYVGDGPNSTLDPVSSNYNPNDFTCAGTNGWVSTVPADLSQVRAVRATNPASAGLTVSIAHLFIYSTVKSSAPIGQDIWTWTSYELGGTWHNPHRSNDPSDVPASGTVTPNSRYPFTGGGRDVLRVIAGDPLIRKTVDQGTTTPGGTVSFALIYRIEAPVVASVENAVITDALPSGLTFVAGSASVLPSSVNQNVLTWTMPQLTTNTDYTIILSARVSDSATAGQSFTNTATVGFGGVTRSATASTRVRDGGYTSITKTADQQQVSHDSGVASDAWTVRITSTDTGTQSFTDTIDILPHNGDGRGTSFSGGYQLSGPVDAVPGATVYYTNADVTELHDDPAHATNGAAGTTTGSTVGWTTVFSDSATAVRVIGPALAPGLSQQFRVGVTTTGASYGDLYVNRAQARASRTGLIMRTSSWFRIAAVNSIAIKKYVQGLDGTWHDAQSIDDFAGFHNGDTVRYRLIVTNTGDQPVENIALADDRFDLTSLSPRPDGLGEGAVISQLLPGADNAYTLEYEVTLAGNTADATVVNNACATAEDDDIEQSCDPAGIRILPSSLSWEKIAVGNRATHLSGSEWELTRVDSQRQPVHAPNIIADCVAEDAQSCDGDDTDHRAGQFRVTGLADGTYRLVETKAPAGYVRDPSPRFIDVTGDSSAAEPFENAPIPVHGLALTGGASADGFLIGAGAASILIAIMLMVQARRRQRDA